MESLTNQCIDLILADLKEKGVAPVQVYNSMGRVWPEFRATQEEVDWANGEYGGNCEVEIDDNAQTSPSHGGKWIAAWVWMSDDEGGSDDATN
jgi:hypothetical protein